MIPHTKSSVGTHARGTWLVHVYCVLSIERAFEFPHKVLQAYSSERRNDRLYRDRLVMKQEMAAYNSGSAHFSEEKFAEMLRATNNSQESITKVSKWMRHNKKYSPKIVNVWLKELRKERNSSKLMILLYVANDVIQNSRKEWPLYMENFGESLERAFSHIAKYTDERTLHSTKRVLKVWRERAVYTGGPIDKFEYAITSHLTTQMLKVWNSSGQVNDSATPSPASKPPTPAKSATNHPVKIVQKPANIPSPLVGVSPKSPDEHELDFAPLSPPPPKHSDEETVSTPPPHKRPHIDYANYASTSKMQSPSKRVSTTTASSSSSTSSNRIPLVCPKVDEIVEAIARLEDPASNDAAKREEIAKLPAAIANLDSVANIRNVQEADALLNQIKQAQPIVESYAQRLQQEYNHRLFTQRLLLDYTTYQQVRERKFDEMQAKCTELRMKMDADRQLATAALSKLPNLNQLPTNEQLAPLPSAADLFGRRP